MKPIPDCVPDSLRMILETAKAVSEDDFIHRKVILKVMGELADEGDLGTNPADIYLKCWEIACRALGVKDPYENEKARSDKTALGILKNLVEQHPTQKLDSLKVAIRISFVGAMLDFTGLGRSDLQEKISLYYNMEPEVNEAPALENAVEKAGTVMLVANRAGEIAMDKPLVELMAGMGKKVFLAVSAKPVYLMATAKDADNAGFSPEISIVSPGTAMYGLMLDRASSEFQELFEDVDLVIVKGCTHFSTLTPQRDVYCILRATQGEVAGGLDIAPSGGAIVKLSPNRE